MCGDFTMWGNHLWGYCLWGFHLWGKRRSPWLPYRIIQEDLFFYIMVLLSPFSLFLFKSDIWGTETVYSNAYNTPHDLTSTYQYNKATKAVAVETIMRVVCCGRIVCLHSTGICQTVAEGLLYYFTSTQGAVDIIKVISSLSCCDFVGCATIFTIIFLFMAHDKQTKQFTPLPCKQGAQKIVPFFRCWYR